MQTRTPRIHFRASANPYPLEMIQQGTQTLNYLMTFPALTSWQVCKLLFLGKPNSRGEVRTNPETARRATNRSLRRLKDLGLVSVKPIARLDNPLTKWELNYLTPQGHRTLTDHRESHGLATLPYQKPNLTYQTMNPHRMAIIDAGISAMAAASRAGITVDVWLDDLTIRSLSKRGQITWPMEPDFLLVLRYEDHREAFLGELDMGTESVDSNRANSIASKLTNYKQYFTSMRANDPWLKDLPQPQVMLVAPSERRLESLKEATAKSGGRSAYWFTTSTLLEPPYSFMGEVWQRIGLDGYYSPAERFVS